MIPETKAMSIHKAIRQGLVLGSFLYAIAFLIGWLWTSSSQETLRAEQIENDLLRAKLNAMVPIQERDLTLIAK